LAVSSEKLQELVNRVKCAAGDYNMAINAAKMKAMTNTDDLSEVEVGVKILEQVNSFV